MRAPRKLTKKRKITMLNKPEKLPNTVTYGVSIVIASNTHQEWLHSGKG